MKVGEQIALQRKQKGMTQEMLSEVSGISLRTIQRIESNQSAPRAYTLKALAEQLNIQPGELTGVDNYPALPAAINAIVHYMDYMDEEQQKSCC